MEIVRQLHLSMAVFVSYAGKVCLQRDISMKLVKCDASLDPNREK